MDEAGNGAVWGSFVAGLVSCATLPIAIYASRFSDRYELLHAGLAIPLAAAAGVVALVLSRRSRARSRVLLSGTEGGGVATAGRILGVLGLCLAASAVVALVVFGLLEYVGSRE